MTRTKHATITLWVCVDCYFSEALGAPSEDPDDQPDREPWSLWSVADQARITQGLVRSEHPCGFMDEETGEEFWQTCECEQVEFTWRSCDGCGSTLGGARQAYTYHEEER